MDDNVHPYARGRARAPSGRAMLEARRELRTCRLLDIGFKFESASCVVVASVFHQQWCHALLGP